MSNMSLMKNEKHYKIGSRKSELAQVQTKSVINDLLEYYPNATFEIVSMDTTGDNIQNVALPQIGEKSLFTKELEQALTEGAVDFLVHSLKDLPTTLPKGLVIGAVCKREDPRDCVIMNPSNKGKTLATLSQGSVIGTSSLRRISQIRSSFPHLCFKDIRGNLNTRFRKLDDDGKAFDAIILAKAGVSRMGWSHRISQVLDPNTECLYAVGQGSLAIECREDDVSILCMLANIADWDASIRAVTERSLLKRLEGGCSVPIAVASSISENNLKLIAGVWSLCGKTSVVKTVLRSLQIVCPVKKFKGQVFIEIVENEKVSSDQLSVAEEMGNTLAEMLLCGGAVKILEKVKEQKNALSLADNTK